MKLNFGSEQRTTTRASPHQFVVWQHAISVDRKVKCALQTTPEFFFIRDCTASATRDENDRQEANN